MSGQQPPSRPPGPPGPPDLPGPGRGTRGPIRGRGPAPPPGVPPIDRPRPAGPPTAALPPAQTGGPPRQPPPQASLPRLAQAQPGPRQPQPPLVLQQQIQRPSGSGRAESGATIPQSGPPRPRTSAPLQRAPPARSHGIAAAGPVLPAPGLILPPSAHFGRAVTPETAAARQSVERGVAPPLRQQLPPTGGLEITRELAGAGRAPPPPNGTGNTVARSSQQVPAVPGTELSLSSMSLGAVSQDSGLVAASAVVPFESVGRGATRESPVPILRTRPDKVVSKMGQGGRPVQLTTNYFAMSRRPNWNLFQYSVEIEPEEDRTRVRKGIVRQLTSQIGMNIFDGTSLYTTNRLHGDPMILTAQKIPPKGVSGDPIPCKVTVRFAREVGSGELSYVHVLNIILRKGLECLGLKQVRRDFFDQAASTPYDRHGLELWPGYRTSIRHHERDLLLCCDTITKILRKDSCLHQIGRARDHDAAVKSLLGQIVMSMYNNKTYKVADIDWKKNPTDKFKGRGGELISFVTYYKTKYGIDIKDMRQPLLVSSATERDRRRFQKEQQDDDDDTVLLIPELCFMTGLTEQQKSNRTLMTDLAAVTRSVPQRRIQSLRKFATRFNGCEEARQELKGFGLEFKPDLEKITGRILAPVPIKHGMVNNPLTYQESSAEWGFGRFRLFGANTCENWAVLFSGRDQTVKVLTRDFITLLLKSAAQIGFRMSDPSPVEMPDTRPATYVRHLKDVIAEKKPVMIMAVVPSNTGIEYEVVKKVCCLEMAMPSQVMTLTVLKKQNALASIAMKVAVQMATKLGGEPWHVGLPYQDLMIVGYDSYHDTTSPGKSVGAVVSTTNATLSKYCSSVAIHSNREELHSHMKLSIIKALKAYFKDNHTLPGRIIIYRDGVGLGQVEFVKTIEIERIISAMKEIYKGGSLPMFTFVVVSKRINTRFFFEGNAATNWNPPSGTVVDDVVTLPELYDFFLVSQSVKQGTVNPTSYNVIEDTSDTTPEHLQRLTYRFTHLYYNWPGTVRVPMVCQYAHKLAFLVGNSLHQRPHHDLDQLLYFL